jgi:Epoxide hydrolase N terminus
MTTDESTIRQFRVEIPEAGLTELRRRISATRWPERETVTDDSQGVRLALMQDLARYWGSDYDWRKCEANLNALPNFVTEIDRLDIHFIHVRSQHEDALPLIVTHGWPGSIIEQLKIIDPLTNPTAHGAFVASEKNGTWGKAEEVPGIARRGRSRLRPEAPVTEIPTKARLTLPLRPTGHARGGTAVRRSAGTRPRLPRLGARLSGAQHAAGRPGENRL